MTHRELLDRVRSLLHMWWSWEASRDRLTTPPGESEMWKALSAERSEVLHEIHAQIIAIDRAYERAVCPHGNKLGTCTDEGCYLADRRRP